MVCDSAIVMTHWNYRLIREGAGIGLVSVREVYYNGEEVVGWSADPVTLDGFESAEEVCQAVALIRKAFTKPVLELG